MKRFTHRIPGNKSNEQPSNIVWVDTETDHTTDDQGHQHHYLRFGWACYQRIQPGSVWSQPEWLRFTEIGAFWDWVCTKCRDKTRLYLFAHNGAFDLPVLHTFSELPALGYTLVSAVADFPPAILTWKHGKKTIRFIDTLNIFRMPLAELGKSIGIAKLPMPLHSDSDTKWDEYGRQDVEIIRQAILQWLTFLRVHDLGGFAPTLAAQSFNAYRHRFMTASILVTDNQKEIDIARASYLGGRTECFAIGNYAGEFYYLDVNSMYPSVMSAGSYPIRLRGVYGHPTFREIRKWLSHLAVIADVVIVTTDPAYPIVLEGKLVFPQGRFRAILCGPELQHALDHGHIESMRSAAVYEQAPIFKQFISWAFAARVNAREAKNTVYDWLIKIFMNSLYGKFGQRGRVFETVGQCAPDLVEVWPSVNHDTKEVTHYRRFGGLEQVWIEEGESRESVPSIASYVTSYARMKMHRAIMKAGRDHCLYCDTDSLVVDHTGYERLLDEIHPTKLGAWKLEKVIKTFQIFGPKDYIMDGDIKSKGVRGSARWIGDDTAEQDHFVGFRGLLRSGNLDEPVVYKIRKHLERRYTKGVVTKTGKVDPLTVDYTIGSAALVVVGVLWVVSEFDGSRRAVQLVL